MSPKLLPKGESHGELSVPEPNPLVLTEQSSRHKTTGQGEVVDGRSPQGHILSRKSTPCLRVALRKAQLMPESDRSKMLHSWETHLHRRKLLTVNSLRLASTVVPPT